MTAAAPPYPRPDRRHTIRRNTAFAFASQVATALFTAVLTFYLARALGVAGFGVFSLAIGFSGLVMRPSDIGTTQAAARFVAERAGEKAAIAGVLGMALRTRLVTATAMGVILIALAGPIAALYHDPSLAWPLRGIGIALFGQSIFRFVAAIFIAMRRTPVGFLVVLGESAMEFTASVLLVVIGGGATGAAFGRAIGYVFGAVLGVLLLGRLLGRSPLLRTGPSPVPRREFVGYAGAMLIVGGASAALSVIDTLLIGAILTTTAVGLFSAPMRLLVLVSYPGLAISQGVAPRLARHRADEPQIQALERAIRYAVIVGAATIAVTTVWAAPVIDVAFGAKYGGSVTVLRALAPYVLLTGLAPVVIAPLNYRGEARRRVPFSIFVLALNAGIDAALLPQIGVVAASIGTDVAMAVNVAVNLWLCERILGLPLAPVAVSAFRSLLAAGAMAGVLAAFGTHSLSPLEWIAGLLAGGAAFALTLIVSRELTPRERRALSTFGARALRSLAPHVASFRRRLALFFLLIVVVPILIVAALVVGVSTTARDAKADARLDGGMRTALGLYRRDLGAGARAARSIASNGALQAAIVQGDPAALRAAARSAAASAGAVAFSVRSPSAPRIASGGFGQAVAVGRVGLAAPGGSAAGSVAAATVKASEFADEARRLTGLDVAIVRGRTKLAGTAPVAASHLPRSGSSSDVEVNGSTQRARTAALPGQGGLELAALAPIPAGGFLASRPEVAIVVAAFIALALVLVLLLLRSLGGQVSAMLAAARRIGAGEFEGEVPVQGNDEMAGLAHEFNKMSGRLAAQMVQLRGQRDEIDRSVRRIGEAFASGLDRQALLEIVVDTALAACNATFGVIALGGRIGAEAEAGQAGPALREALVAAEERAARSGELSSHAADGAYAVASPIVPSDGDQVGVMSLARESEPFSAVECDVFRYLLGQAAVSIENIALHELVSEQAVTDDLTGLSNQRRFRDVLSKEAVRAGRFGHPLSLLMLDIDDFKAINDTRGHVQGDAVLRGAARILAEESRTVDEPARYGGDEFAVALPETDLAGAVDVGERIRSRLEAETVPSIDGHDPVRVTASIGVAAIPTSAHDPDGVVQAADAALYEAKRLGKNRVCKADTVAPPPPRAQPAAR